MNFDKEPKLSCPKCSKPIEELLRGEMSVGGVKKEIGICPNCISPLKTFD